MWEYGIKVDSNLRDRVRVERLPPMYTLRRLWAVAALTSLVAAAPAAVRRDVSAGVLANLDLFAQYSAAAYCDSNLNSDGTKLACQAGNCPLVEAADTETLDEFDMTATYGNVAGYIAVDRTNRLLVLAFRGSASISNWIANLNLGLTDASALCAGCRVHSGFWEAWQTAEATISDIIASAAQTYPGYTLVATGHSYGAALAAIAATKFRNEGYAVELYDYGQPRIGNLALAQYITNQSSGGNFRVTHTNDIVPKLPPDWLGYSHFGPEYWITSGDGIPVTAADVEVISGVDATGGNDGAEGTSVDAHRWYFVNISQCE